MDHQDRRIPTRNVLASSLMVAGGLLLSCAPPPAPPAPPASAQPAAAPLSPAAEPAPAPSQAASGALAPAASQPSPPAESCVDRRNAAYQQAQAAVAAADKACAADADCVVVQTGHNCGGACPVGVRAGAEGGVRQAIAQIDRRCEGFREACPSHFAWSRCAVVLPRCQAGQCVAREPASLGPYCCTGTCRRGNKGNISTCSECRLLSADRRGECSGTTVSCQTRADFALGELTCDAP
jgi:hypothetical protein